ncbi:DNA-binding transcriptional regulator, AcrR family [Amycolatopsis sacchari]|uniref:DNA-binding transcriptional regulator, AcrR family n=1 Tax=Amycolatopsis sacchari TaxID=115433 RepID=A0A1I3T4C5_9PSEU|nr:TetR/AcrR family transcriptional regulator [Amycolatopsis sacchari]SFJ65894.1 DNA-binding transcriptional regulator, AcrR family [Amycolatopsis sacchari]
MDETEGRSARKRNAIMAAATELFLQNGYQGTSMDQVAARAAVSKQTVYKNFADKERLFSEIVRGVADNSDRIVELLGEPLRAGITSRADLEAALTEVARRYLDAVLRPNVLQLRRLVIAEADRFPGLARDYYERGPERGITVLASALEHYATRGLLRFDDARLAAAHLAYLALAIPQDKALFCPGENPGAAAREHIARSAVRVFLAAYG